jgi:hypothetical protein
MVKAKLLADLKKRQSGNWIPDSHFGLSTLREGDYFFVYSFPS